VVDELISTVDRRNRVALDGVVDAERGRILPALRQRGDDHGRLNCSGPRVPGVRSAGGRRAEVSLVNPDRLRCQLHPLLRVECRYDAGLRAG